MVKKRGRGRPKKRPVNDHFTALNYDPDFQAKRLAAWHKWHDAHPDFYRKLAKRTSSRQAEYNQKKRDELKAYGIANPRINRNKGSFELQKRQEIAKHILSEYGLECAPDQPRKYYEDIIRALDPEKAMMLGL